MINPPCLIFCNSDLGDPALNYIKRQLFIDEVISKETFDTRVELSRDGYNYLNQYVGDQDGYEGASFINVATGEYSYWAPPIFYPTYPNAVHNSNKRILVLIDMQDYTNRNLADLVLFIKNNLASSEKNKFGGPFKSILLERINYNFFCIKSQPYTPVYDID